MTQEPPFDRARAHRWFAVEFNNEAWPIVENKITTDDERERLIHLAHASVHHWLNIGEPINKQRGYSLLVSVYVVAKLPQRAVHYAKACLQLSENAGETQDPFDRAAALGGMAIAYTLADRIDEARQFHARFQQCLTNLDTSGDVELLNQLYPAP